MKPHCEICEQKELCPIENVLEVMRHRQGCGFLNFVQEKKIHLHYFCMKMYKEWTILTDIGFNPLEEKDKWKALL